jgi:signal transduction histidine kinase
VSFRTRLLLAFAVATLISLSLLAVGIRHQVTARITAQHERRVDALARVAMQDLERQNADISARLHSLVLSLADDNRFRVALQGAPAERSFLLDWAGGAMQVAGLSMLQLQDDAGRILSSGHFRNEYDRLEPQLPRLLASAADRPTVVRVRAPEGPMLVLARVDSTRIGSRALTLVGGLTIDRSFLDRFARDSEVAVSLVTPDDTIASDSANTPGLVSGAEQLSYISALGDSMQLSSARIVVTHTSGELEALRRDVDRWFAAALAAAAFAGLAIAFWLSAGLSKPLAALTRATSSISLEGPELEFANARDDEIGTLARRFGVMGRRLRANAAQLVDAERRATRGEMARQVNHDVKNGLIPIRNVVQHLAQVQERDPQRLPAVFAERRSTLDSSIAYLETLARNYARLTPRFDRRSFDASTVARDAAHSASSDGVIVKTRIADSPTAALGDPVLLRRILENLLRNAIESLPSSGGDVTLETTRAPSGGVRLIVADTGKGMTDAELTRAFEDFHTTKPGGTGLGLSVVRRLAADLNADLRVESAPGRGTTFTIDLPPAPPSPPQSDSPA